MTRGASKGIYVFVIPVGAELDLKKAAKAVGEKSIEMVHVSEINALTGYIRGGCSPVGMRKHYTTTYDASALAQDTMIVSAGKIGFQVELEPQAHRATAIARTRSSAVIFFIFLISSLKLNYHITLKINIYSFELFRVYIYIRILSTVVFAQVHES